MRSFKVARVRVYSVCWHVQKKNQKNSVVLGCSLKGVGEGFVLWSLYLPYRFHMGTRFLGLGDIGFGRSVCSRNGSECRCGCR